MRYFKWIWVFLNHCTIVAILRFWFKGKLVSLSDRNSLHLWEINDTAVEEVKTLTMEGKWVNITKLLPLKVSIFKRACLVCSSCPFRLKKISSLYVENSKENLLIGTEGGNIYYVTLSSFIIFEKVIYQDVVMQK